MMLLDIPGVQGESMSPNATWNAKIQIATMGYDVTQTTTGGTGTGLVANGAQVAAMTLSKSMDKSTPYLFQNLIQGEPIPIVYVRVIRSGQKSGSSTVSPTGGLYEAETYTLSNAIISNYSTSGALGPGGLPLETWSIAFTKIVENYVTVDPTTGNPISGGTPVGYDFSQATPI